MAGQVHGYRKERKGATMLTQTSPTVEARTKMFLDIPTAAELAGFSIRHFRRIIEEDGIPIVQIGRKFFILGKDFSNWESGKKTKRAA
jgi:hypothetical protein